MNLTDNASRVSCSECAPQLWIWMYWVLVNNDSHLKCVRPNGGITEKQRANGTRTHTHTHNFNGGKGEQKLKTKINKIEKPKAARKTFIHLKVSELMRLVHQAKWVSSSEYSKGSLRELRVQFTENVSWVSNELCASTEADNWLMYEKVKVILIILYSNWCVAKLYSRHSL